MKGFFYTCGKKMISLVECFLFVGSVVFFIFFNQLLKNDLFGVDNRIVEIYS